MTKALDERIGRFRNRRRWKMRRMKGQKKRWGYGWGRMTYVHRMRSKIRTQKQNRTMASLWPCLDLSASQPHLATYPHPVWESCVREAFISLRHSPPLWDLVKAAAQREGGTEGREGDGAWLLLVVNVVYSSPALVFMGCQMAERKSNTCLRFVIWSWGLYITFALWWRTGNVYHDVRHFFEFWEGYLRFCLPCLFIW